MARAKKAKEFTMTAEFADDLTKWNQAAQNLEAWKKIEMQLRLKLVAAGFDIKVLEGTETIDIGNGWKLKVNKKQNYAATNKNGEAMALLNAIGATNPELACNLIEWKPDLKTKAYKELLKLNLPGIDRFLAEAVTIKPGAPELELVPPQPAVEQAQQ